MIFLMKHLLAIYFGFAIFILPDKKLPGWRLSSINPANRIMVVKNEYPEKHGYAPPTQVIFSNQLFLGKNEHYFNVYHSSEKYSEPYLCIEPVEIDGETLKVLSPKSNNQKVTFK